MNTLDNILSGGSEDAPAQDQTTEEQVTQAATEGASQTEQPTEGQQQEGEGDGRQKLVPHEALHAEKQKVKRYTEEVADFRKLLAESNARIAELAEAVKPKQEPAAPPDFFDNPQAATQHEVQQTVSPEFARINQTLNAFARDHAIDRFTAATVDEAESAFIKSVQAGALDPSDYRRVVNSPNRYAEAVKWHQRQQAQAEIGDDPTAFKAKVEAELREKILAEINGGNGQQTLQRSAPVTPSNLAGARNVGTRTTGPAWSGPASLTDIFDRRRAEQ